MLKYKTELIVLIPLFIGWMGLYFIMGLQQSMYIVYPERLINNRYFIVLALITVILTLVMLSIEIPSLHVLNKPLVFNGF